MDIMKKLIFALILISGASFDVAGQVNDINTIGLENIQVQGGLQKRIIRNFDRLESQRFQPIEDVGCFRESRYSWPGDM